MDHYARLDAETLRARFYCPISGSAALRMAARSRPDVVIALSLGTTVRGVCEVYRLSDGRGEMALSTEQGFQGCGFGRQLFEAGCSAAQEAGFPSLVIHAARDRHAILHMLRKAGATMNTHSDGVTAHLTLSRSGPPESPCAPMAHRSAHL